MIKRSCTLGSRKIPKSDVCKSLNIKDLWKKIKILSESAPKAPEALFEKIPFVIRERAARTKKRYLLKSRLLFKGAPFRRLSAI